MLAMTRSFVALVVSAVRAQDLFLSQRVHEAGAGNCCWGGTSCATASDCHVDAYCGASEDHCGNCAGTWCPSGHTPAPTQLAPTPPSPLPPSAGCGEMPQSATTQTISNQGKFSVWHKDLGVLLWVDSPAYTPDWKGSIVYAFRPSDGKTFTIVQYDADIVGSVMPRKGGGIVLAISKKNGNSYNSAFYAMHVDPHTFEGSNLVMLASLPSGSPGKFNNGNCDPMGRYWAGTYCPDGGSCSVWVLERSGSGYNVREGISNIQHPNGLIWVNSGTELMFSNTGLNMVLKYQYSLKNGSVSDGTTFIRGGEGLLDSMCGLEDGSLVIANPGSSQLQRFTLEGEAACTIQVPSDFVASCAFAPNGDLYIPTGRNGGSVTGPAGWLFKTRGLGLGLEPTPCDV